MDGLGAGLAAMAFWGFVAVAVVAGVWDGNRKREAQHETLRRMIDGGLPIDQSLVDEVLGGKQRRADRDLRVAGLIVLFVAPGLALLGWFISLQYDDVLLPMIGVAALVACVGIGLLAASRVMGRPPGRGDSSSRRRVA